MGKIKQVGGTQLPVEEGGEVEAVKYDTGNKLFELQERKTRTILSDASKKITTIFGTISNFLRTRNLCGT